MNASSSTPNPRLVWLVTTAPRLLIHLASVAALAGLASSCVPAKQYDEARSAALAESEARKDESEKLRAAEQRIAELSAELEKKKVELEREQSALAATKLETTVAAKDREAAGMLVQQLQADLARAGDHLAWFSSEKRDLGKALLLAEQRSDDVERASGMLRELVGASRDLALLLGEDQGMGELVLGAKDGRVVLEVPEARLFAEGSDALVVDAAPVLAGVARAGAAHGALKIVVRPPAASELESQRAARLIDALAERGMPRDRLGSELPEAAPVAPAPAPAPVAADDAQDPAVEAPVAPSVAPAAPAEPRFYALAFTP